MEKDQLRQEIRSMLRSMPEKDRIVKSKTACKNLVSTEQFQKASVIMLYLSLPQEVDTADAILYGWQMGKTIAVPKVSWQQRHMIPVEITTLETGFSTEVSGLRNPVTGVPVPFGDIDLVVTPGLSFDRKGNRLGRGGSYYDRFFANPQVRAKRCGFAFDDQIRQEVPTSDRDQPIDLLVTNKEVIYFDKIQG